MTSNRELPLRHQIPLRDQSGKDLGEQTSLGWSYNGDDLLRGVHMPSDWGPWRLDSINLVLTCDGDGAGHYSLDLERCRTAAQVLDYIAQVAGKPWADDATLAGLVRALEDTLRLQANVCSFGKSGPPLSKVRIKELGERTAATRLEGFEIYPELRPPSLESGE